MLELVVFYIFGIVAVVSSLLVITRHNAVHSALFLAVTLLAVAGVFLSLGAEFLAGVQVIVYVGGVVVLFVFVIMLVPNDRVLIERRYNRQSRMVLVVAALLAGELIYALYQGGGFAQATGEVQPAVEGNSQWVGTVLYQNYLLPFEIASILLLVAIIGAVVLSKKASPDDPQQGEA